MRYWHPFANEAAAQVKAWNPDRILLLPLYPQFSTTTTGSSLTDWHEAAAAAGLVKPTTTLCCYFDDPDYVDSIAALVDAPLPRRKPHCRRGIKITVAVFGARLAGEHRHRRRSVPGAGRSQ